ncbi:MAG: HAD family phosphatase [Halofilum sp. (in: g-proteobacteria)]|nr:HAD family phosphatase [Halofilum sp. (in: g-proteobacteria)]
MNDDAPVDEARAREAGPLRALLLDFGGVVATEGFRDGLRHLAETQGLDPEHVLAMGPVAVHQSGYVTGTGTEADFWRLMRGRARLRGTDRELTAAILERFVVRDWMLDYVRRVRAAGLAAAIISDQTDWLERLDARDHFAAAFDRVFNSYRLGRSKRDPAIFDAVVAALGVAPGAALFVDDTAAHVERARGRGLAGIVYRDRRQLAADLAAWPELPGLAPEGAPAGPA